jgi:hypothetical protein
MQRNKLNPAEQKAKLITLQKEIERKIAKFEQGRIQKIGLLAKQFNLLDLDDALLEKEFEQIYERHGSPVEDSTNKKKTTSAVEIS